MNMIELEKILGQLTIILQTNAYTKLPEVHKALSNYIYDNMPEDVRQYSWSSKDWNK
jgi:hypothetical protein